MGCVERAAILLLLAAAGAVHVSGLTAPPCDARAPVLRLCGGGRGEGCAATLSWSAVSLSVGGRTILEGVSGRAFEGRILAIMGPSGAGKTSLLHVLGGMLAKRPVRISLIHLFVGRHDYWWHVCYSAEYLF